MQDPPLQALLGLLQMLDPRLLYFGLLPRRGRVLVEFIPLLLPVQHGVLGLLQGLGRFFLHRVQHFQFRTQGFQLHFPGVQLALILLQVLPGFLETDESLAQIVVELARPLLLERDRLLDPRDFGTQGIVVRLDLVEGIRALAVVLAALLDGSVDLLVLGIHRFQPHLQLGYRLGAGRGLLVQLLPLQSLQLGFQGPLFALVFGIFFRCLGLPLQVLELALQFVAQIGEPLQVLHGAAHAVLGFTAPLLVLGDPRGFLDEHAQLFRPGLDQARNHALLDNRIAARSETGAEEDVGNVAAAAAAAVEKVFGLGFAGHQAADGNFRIAGVLAADAAIAVVKDQFDGGLAHRLPVDRAIENDVGHGFAAQILGRALAHHPAHRVNDVGFAATVGAHHRRHVAGEVHRCRVDKGFEAGELDGV